MNTGKVNIILIVTAFLALGGCATGPASYTKDAPILSAADANSMISVEVRELEPLPVERAIAAASN